MLSVAGRREQRTRTRMCNTQSEPADEARRWLVAVAATRRAEPDFQREPQVIRTEESLMVTGVPQYRSRLHAVALGEMQTL